jgi:hypothetical protein
MATATLSRPASSWFYLLPVDGRVRPVCEECAPLLSGHARRERHNETGHRLRCAVCGDVIPCDRMEKLLAAY